MEGPAGDLAVASLEKRERSYKHLMKGATNMHGVLAVVTSADNGERRVSVIACVRVSVIFLMAIFLMP